MDKEPAFDPAAITDVETGRLALRWALEKTHVLQKETQQLREDLNLETANSRQLSEQLAQKEEALKRWQSTLRVWEENAAIQRNVEEGLRAKLKEEVLKNELAHLSEENAQLKAQIQSLREELKAKAIELGAARLQADEHSRRVEAEKQAELRTLLGPKEQALDLLKKELFEKFDSYAKSVGQAEQTLRERRLQADRELSERAGRMEEEFQSRRVLLEEELRLRWEKREKERGREIESSRHASAKEENPAELQQNLSQLEAELKERLEAEFKQKEALAAQRLEAEQEAWHQRAEALEQDYNERMKQARADFEKTLEARERQLRARITELETGRDLG